MVIYKDGTHLVIKKDDAVHLLSDEQIRNLADITKTISQGRAAQGKKDNAYYICNQDEPYAVKVLATILEGEQEKQEETYGSETQICVDDPSEGIRPIQPSDLRSTEESQL